MAIEVGEYNKEEALQCNALGLFEISSIVLSEVKTISTEGRLKGVAIVVRIHKLFS